MRRIAFAALLVTSSALAKKIETADDAPAHDDPVAVRAKLDGTTARMVVDYRITTQAEAFFSQFEFPLPTGGVVVGATLTHGGSTHRMALDASDSVEKKFIDAFSEAKHGPARTWVAKIDANSYGLRGYGVSLMIGGPKSTEVVVSLEITAPTCFFRDARYVQAPDGWEHVVRPAKVNDQLLVMCADTNDGVDPSGTWMAFAAPEPARMASGERLFTQTARLAIDTGFHVARTELALAANIADVPRDLATVILVDESRSMSDQQRKAQREIVLGYLRAAPNSRVQVIAFSRRTHALLAGWTMAARAGSRVERELASMLPRNGSNFDLGLADAGRLLSAIKGTRRVVLITDDALASRLAETPERLASLVPAGTIINIAVVGAGGEDLARNDEVRLARLAATTAGFSTSVGGLELDDRRDIDATMLVRPTSLDHLTVTGLGWSELEDTARRTLGGHTCASSLDAGESCVWWTRGTKFASTIQFEGLLWNRRVVRLVRPLGDLGHTIARELVGTNTTLGDGDPDLDGDGVTATSKRIDALAHAVTGSTSLFVRWGSSDPIPDAVIFGGMGGFGRSGTIGSISDIGRILTARSTSIDLTPQLRPLVASCGLGTTRAEIKLELTFQEIVDVDVTLGDTGTHAATVRTCIEDAVWDFVPMLPSLEPSRTETIVL